jgi:hypothetical protein
MSKIKKNKIRRDVTLHHSQNIIHCNNVFYLGFLNFYFFEFHLSTFNLLEQLQHMSKLNSHNQKTAVKPIL